MSRFIHFACLLMVFALLGLVACGSNAPTTDPSLAYTQIYLTVLTARAQTEAASSPTPSLTDTPVSSPTVGSTNTPLISATPLFTFTPLATAAPVNTQPSTCDNMVGVADVTYPDGSEVPAGSVFIKTWSIKNLGPCNWDLNYRLAFGWGGVGTNWNTTPPAHLTANVLPGETIEVSVALTAPITPGNYAAAFRMQNASGYNFGPTQTVVVVVK